jgi:hypothetical protein
VKGVAIAVIYKNENNLVTLPPSPNQTFNFEQLNVIGIFQRLWTQLAVYTRYYIYSIIFNLPSAQAAGERLFQVPADFRNAFLTFYGPEIANRFGNLFTNFVAKPANVIEGYQSNNQDLINQSTQTWYQSANELAHFLARINLFWDEDQWKNLLNQYIQLKLDMIVAVISGDFRREVQIYDRLFDLTTIMGTYMARGIIARQLQLNAPVNAPVNAPAKYASE